MSKEFKRQLWTKVGQRKTRARQTGNNIREYPQPVGLVCVTYPLAAVPGGWTCLPALARAFAALILAGVTFAAAIFRSDLEDPPLAPSRPITAATEASAKGGGGAACTIGSRKRPRRPPSSGIPRPPFATQTPTCLRDHSRPGFIGGVFDSFPVSARLDGWNQATTAGGVITTGTAAVRAFFQAWGSNSAMRFIG